ncbi:MAG TPA: VWA domain-containing protein [Thermoanaerobaculia bacterium]|nr:VWA domain-containing protein [Thermoanaerobaculia bacterium]
MSFRSMNLLWLLALVPFALLFLLSRERLRTRIARRFASERLRGVGNPARPLRPWLLGAALALAVLALAGPYAGTKLVPIVAREANRVLVIDVSNSMAAEDVGTSRLSAAKAIAMRLANAHQGRVALIVFEGTPEVASPLTTDTDAVAALIDSVVPGEVGTPGSDVGSAIFAAVRLIAGEGAQNADVVVISDGEDQGARVDEAKRRARTSGIEISTIVVGTPDGSTIPTGRGPLRDEGGEIVTTFARTDVLGDIARSTGGTMLENPFGARALDPLLTTEGAVATHQTHARVPVDRYQWPLAFAVVLLFAGSLLHRGAE